MQYLSEKVCQTDFITLDVMLSLIHDMRDPATDLQLQNQRACYLFLADKFAKNRGKNIDQYCKHIDAFRGIQHPMSFFQFVA